MKYFLITLLLTVSLSCYGESNKEFGYYLVTNPEKIVVFAENRKQLNLSHVIEKAEPCDKGDARVCIKSERTFFTVPIADQMKEQTTIPGTALFIEKISKIKIDGAYKKLIQISGKETDDINVTYYYSPTLGLRYFTVLNDSETLIYMLLGDTGYGAVGR